MKKIITACLAGAMLTGCAYTKITDGKFTATRVTFGSKTAIGELTANEGTNSIAVKQYSNDQVEALGVIAKSVAEGLVSGAAKSVKPVP